MRQISFAIRSLLRSKGFGFAAIVTLAVAVGANTAMFGVLHAVLLRALPYPEPSRLVEVGRTSGRGARTVESVTYPQFERWQEDSRSFQSLAAYFQFTGVSRITLNGSDEPEAAKAAFVSADFFEVMGVPPRMGRVFSKEEERRHEPVIVLSDSQWRRRFGDTEHLNGSSLRINGLVFRVIGVMPASYAWPSRDAIAWIPMTHNRDWARRAESVPFFRVAGRLKPGVSRSAAENEMVTLYSDSREQFAVVPLRPPLDPGQERTLYLLAAAVGLVLLIASANLASLNLARGARRRSELALRIALGASRARVTGEVFLESLLLAVAGAGAGALLANGMLDVIVRFRPNSIERIDEAGFNSAVLAFSVAATLLSTVLAGLLPAWKMSGYDPATALRTRSGGGTGAIGSVRTRQLLLIGELALTVPLLAVSGLMLRSLAATRNVDLGFEPSNALTFRVQFLNTTPPERRVEYFRTLFERLSALPQITAVGAVNDLFEVAGPSALGLREVEGHASEPRDAWTPLTWTTVAGSYFGGMGAQLLQGRWFLDSDGPASSPVAMIDESAARRYWPGENPVGARFRGQDARGRNDEWVTVIGVVRNMRRQGLDREPTAHIYEWYRQRGATMPRDVIVRTAAPLSSEVRAVARSLDATVVLSGVQSLQSEIEAQLTSRRFQAGLLSGFSAIAFMLSAVGIYGVVSYSVAMRIREFGIRTALGESGTGLCARVLKEASILAIAGIVPGLLGAWFVSGFLRAMVFGVSPLDPVSFVGASVLLGATAIFAAWVPAMRAARVDPLVALREE